MNTTVLLATTSRWFPTARLAVTLANAGCQVHAVCPQGHPISKTVVGRHTFTYDALTPLRSFSAAISKTNPDLIVSGDDLATWHLHELYRRSLKAGASGAARAQLIERSLGAPEHFPIVEDRASFIQIAHEAGVRVPANSIISNSEQLQNWAANASFPAVIKANGTSGGEGVLLVKSAAAALSAFNYLHAPPFFTRAIKRAILDRDATLLRPSLLRQKAVVNAQSFIQGREATSALACWNGTVLASLHFEVLQKSHASGHATVLRRTAHPEMIAATETMVRRLRLSGLQGFDFMLDAQTSAAYLIEINPRATQVCHLNLGERQDLPGALVSALTGMPVTPSPSVTQNDVITLFPQEWARNPASPYIRSGYHDVPWEQPALLRACLRKPSQMATLWGLAKRRPRNPK